MYLCIRPFSGGGGGQIALRFPGDNTGPDFELYEGWEKHWHIDGLCTPNSNNNSIPSGDIHNFTALVGVLLQDVPAANMGNLVLYPGSHYQLQDYFRSNGFENVLSRGTAALPMALVANNISSTSSGKSSRGPVQICGRAGDAIIVNYMTAHLVAPNTSSSVRYVAVYGAMWYVLCTLPFIMTFSRYRYFIG
jgi:hypothetical protein